MKVIIPNDTVSSFIHKPIRIVRTATTYGAWSDRSALRRCDGDARRGLRM